MKISFPRIAIVFYVLGPALILVGLPTIFGAPGDGFRIDMTQVAVGSAMFWLGVLLFLTAVILTSVRAMLHAHLVQVGQLHKHGTAEWLGDT